VHDPAGAWTWAIRFREKHSCSPKTKIGTLRTCQTHNPGPKIIVPDCPLRPLLNVSSFLSRSFQSNARILVTDTRNPGKRGEKESKDKDFAILYLHRESNLGPREVDY